MEGNADKSNRNLSRNIITAIAALLAVVIFVLYFIRNFTFSFLPLLCILFLLMIIIGTKIREFRINPDKTIVASATSALLVFTFGALCLFTLDNYINPSKDIFRNNDHHTLVAEGFHIKDTRHIELAGNNSEALFDNETFNGSIFLDKTRQEIRGNDTIKIVSLQEKGFSTPIYSRHRESLNWIQKLFRDNRPYFKDIDSESAEIFSQGDTIVLSRGKATATFCIKEWKDSLGASYFLTYTDKSGRLQQVESPFTAYLRRSYPLSAMFQNTDIPGLNLNGIVLYRTVFFDTQVDNVRKRYKRLGARYRLALENSSDKNIRIWIQGHSFDPTHETKTFDLKADGTTVYAIGTTEEAAPQFRLYPEKKGISLRYRMPKYRYLSADYTQEQETENLEEITFMVASTILDPDGSVSQLIPENILLYDIFDHPNNIHQLRPAFLTFVSGPTNSRLKFSLYSTDGSIDSKDLVAGSLCPELPTSDDNVSWIISIDNFKDNTLVRPGEIQRPQSARTIAIILIVVTLLSVITIMIHGGKRYTYVEPMVYLVLLAFLTIRLFLLWRISVFPPVMSTTVSEFNGIFRNPTSLSYIILFLAGFYAVILTVKIFGIKNGSPLLNLLYRDPSTYCSSEKLKRGFYYAIFGEPLLLIVMAVVLRSVHFTDRFFCVLLPIVIFFVVDYLANRFYGGRYREKYAQDVDLRYLWVLMANSIGTTIYTFVMDGGFGIIFLLFSVTNITLRMIDAYLYKGHDRHKVYINRWIYTLSVFAIFILTFSKKILLQLLDGLAFAITVFIIMTVVYIAILLMFNIIRFEHRHLADKIKTMKIIGAGVLAIALFSTTTIWAPRLFEGNHIEYRLKVQSDDPGNVLGKLQSATAERKFLEASINDWVMGEYNLRGKMINVVGERGSGYFKVQPQSKVGALWGAQTTDISLSRYVIAEHGQLLAIMLIVILGTLLNFCISFVSNRIWSKALITQIPLLLSIQALLVWMAVTQRFIFLGQDFPMISVTSNLTSILFIGLMAVLVVVALIESTLCLDRQERSHAIDLIIINRRMSGHVRLFTSLILILLLINQRYQSFYQKKTDTATRYDVKSSLEALKISINAFNEEFIAYQQQVMDSLSRGRRPIRDITQTPIGASPYQCLWAYCRDNQYDPNTPETEENTASLPNYFRIVGESYSGFCKMAFDRYLKNGVRKNDIYGLIFTAKKKSRIDGMLNVVYELKVYDQYYAHELPRTIKDSWKGNIVSLPVGISTDSIPPISQERGFTVYTLPQSWTRAEGPVRLLKSTSQNLVVVGKQRPQVLRRGESCYLYESDNVLVNGRNADVSKYGNVSFLAKNVLINGAFTFVYPLQNKLFWMRSFSNCVQIDKASYDVDSEASKEDIYVTLSPTLTSDIYDTFDRMRPTMMSAAVVADGNGNIVAMVDHKDPEHRLNPNDLKSIVKKETELRLEGEYYWGQEAENYFGNKSITNLRFGPGSSQKPLVWTAVTTQYNDTDFWQRLKLARINPHLMESTDNSHFSTRFLAGTLLSRGTRVRGTRRYAYFQSLKGDEGGGENAVDLTAYLYKSSNYYNAIMTFIGSYSYDDLTIGLDTKDPEASLFRPLDSDLLTSQMADDTLKYRTAFPIMQLGNGKPFAFKSIPSLDIIENADNSLLVKGLNINFNLPSVMDRTLRPEIYQYKTERVRNRSDFAHPQVSYFLNKYRADALDKARADYAIRYTALGASSVWQVSPLMMAQMYGGLISLNRNYTLSIMPKEEDDLEYERFEIDNVPSTYDNIGSYFNIRSTFVKSLSMVFHERGGTGNHVFNLLRTYKKDTNNGALLATAVDGSEKKLFLYGKTGTINGTDNTGTSQEDHLFAVIISDTDLEEAKSVETHEKMKFYVIYIADFGRQGWVASDAAVIDTVLASKEFKHYMGIK